jgi:hypothetical protein
MIYFFWFGWLRRVWIYNRGLCAEVEGYDSQFPAIISENFPGCKEIDINISRFTFGKWVLVCGE